MTKQDEFNNAVHNNDIKNATLLIKDNDVNPANNNNYAICEASKLGNFDIVVLLLKDERVDPSVNYNESTFWANNNEYYNILEVIWKDQRVKNTLVNDDLSLYNKLIKNLR